jgi:hypothetical protein
MADDAIISSENLHNANCHAYLKQVYLPALLKSKLPEAMYERLVQCQNAYQPNFAYADLYLSFYQFMDEQIQQLCTAHPESTAELDRCVLSMFVNNNHNLRTTFNAIKHIPLRHRPISPDIEGSITYYISDNGIRVNKSQSPSDMNTWCARFFSILDNNYKPQYTTGLSSVRQYRATQDYAFQDLRMSTQGQRHNGTPRVSPLFEAFLKAQTRQQLGESGITHLYFNMLNRDRTSYIGKKEKELTLQLEALEDRHSNVAVITLPADSGIMNILAYRNTSPLHSYQDVKKDLLLIATQNPLSKEEFKDFYISPRVRALLFKDHTGHYNPEAERTKLTALLDKSFASMGVEPSIPLSDATRQAVWFHFIKYELTHYIIEKLSTDANGERRPLTLNFSCKDGIDRGGIASAYYHLMRSFELSTQPMNQNEFDEALHAPPTMVKARGMNHHLQVIWNAVDGYVNQRYDQLIQHSDRQWLISWRDQNCPHSRINGLLKTRVRQLSQELGNTVDSGKAELIQRGLQILQLIQAQIDINTSGKRLLLEAAVKTVELLKNPSPETLPRYIQLAETMIENYPTLNILCGAMKALIGGIFYLCSFGIYTNLLKSGIAIFNSGWYAQQKLDLHLAMKSAILLFSPPRLTLHETHTTDKTPANAVNGLNEAKECRPSTMTSLM